MLGRSPSLPFSGSPVIENGVSNMSSHPKGFSYVGGFSSNKPFNYDGELTNDKCIDKLKFYGIDVRKTIKCPICNSINSFGWTLPHLNDTHKWTLKDIGLWLKIIGY